MVVLGMSEHMQKIFMDFRSQQGEGWENWIYAMDNTFPTVKADLTALLFAMLNEDCDNRPTMEHVSNTLGTFVEQFP